MNTQNFETMDASEMDDVCGGSIFDALHVARDYAFAAGQIVRDEVVNAWNAYIDHCAETGCLPPS